MINSDGGTSLMPIRKGKVAPLPPHDEMLSRNSILPYFHGVDSKTRNFRERRSTD
nr:hypothetical protein Q903MT_gene1478 [Picea sitchensis]